MNNLLAGLASADIDPSPYVETIMGLGRKLIRVEVLDEEQNKRLDPNEKDLLKELITNLETAKKKLTEVEEASKPFQYERETSLFGIAALEETIEKLLSALVEARGNLVALKDNIPRLDVILAEVERDALTRAGEV